MEPPADYHADHSAISSSMLRNAERHGLPLYRDWYIDHVADPPGATEAMNFGTRVHCGVLEPEKVAERFLVVPKLDRRKTADKKRAEEIQVELAATGRIALTQQQETIARRAVERVIENQEAARLLAMDGETEKPGYWIDRTTGLRCKRKVDKRFVDDGVVVVIDLKTCRELPTERNVRKAIRDRCYDGQAAHYLDAEPPESLKRFAWIFVQSVEPHAVAVWWASSDVIHGGRDINRRTLGLISEAMTSGIWTIPEEITQNIVRKVR